MDTKETHAYNRLGCEIENMVSILGSIATHDLGRGGGWLILPFDHHEHLQFDDM